MSEVRRNLYTWAILLEAVTCAVEIRFAILCIIDLDFVLRFILAYLMSMLMLWKAF